MTALRREFRRSSLWPCLRPCLRYRPGLATTASPRYLYGPPYDTAVAPPWPRCGPRPGLATASLWPRCGFGPSCGSVCGFGPVLRLTASSRSRCGLRPLPGSLTGLCPRCGSGPVYGVVCGSGTVVASLWLVTDPSRRLGPLTGPHPRPQTHPGPRHWLTASLWPHHRPLSPAHGLAHRPSPWPVSSLWPRFAAWRGRRRVYGPGRGVGCGAGCLTLLRGAQARVAAWRGCGHGLAGCGVVFCVCAGQVVFFVPHKFLSVYRTCRSNHVFAVLHPLEHMFLCVPHHIRNF